MKGKTEIKVDELIKLKTDSEKLKNYIRFNIQQHKIGL